jgi:hypothetical protein
MTVGNPRRRRAAAKKRAPQRASAKKAAAARRNGRRGGRPAGVLPDHLQRMLAAPPIGKPLDQPGWATDVILLVAQARLEGHPGIDTLAKELRADFTVMSKLQAQASLYKAAKVLKEEQEGRGADDGPDEEDVDAGDGSPAALHGDPT